MNTWILDTAIARLLSSNAVVLTEPPNSQVVGQPEASAAQASFKRALEELNPAELTVICCCWDGKKLEAESSCLFAEALFGSPLCLFITTVDDGFCVGYPSQHETGSWLRRCSCAFKLGPLSVSFDPEI